MIPIIIQNLLFGGLLAYIFAKWAGIKTFMTGLKTGGVLGLILGLTIASMFFGAVNIFDGKIFLIGPLSFLVRFGLAGGIIGWILGKSNQS